MIVTAQANPSAFNPSSARVERPFWRMPMRLSHSGSKILLVSIAAFLTASCGEYPETGASDDLNQIEEAKPAPAAGSIADTKIAETLPDDAAYALDLNDFIAEDARGVDIINGMWAETPEECASEFAVFFENGVYRDSAGSGPWRAEGDTIIIDYRSFATDSDYQHLVADIRLKVLELSAGRIVWEANGGTVHSLRICQ